MGYRFRSFLVRIMERSGVGRRKLFRFLFFSLLILVLPTVTLAADIDIYSNDSGVEPNILVIFDNSASMNESITSAAYEPSETYAGTYETTKVYYRWKGSWDNVFRDSVGEITCDDARTALQTEGFFNGKNPI
ncbi:MAG: hypothetical protein GTN74_15960 [Proteobacteria bacterium]|nr:hypothetical protein [Pseudomonadota bacterium]NIS72129.1 hypothetical protein [Pseudomonadota bacterium]